MISDGRRALRLAGLLLAGAVTVTLAVWATPVRSVLQWADDGFLRLMKAGQVEPAVSVAKALAFVGGVWCTWIIRGAVLAVLGWRRHWLHLTAFLAAVATSEALIGALKPAMARSRPVGSLVGTSGASFPS